ncbi:hypothetical protein GIB67_026025 [Kingdonia uniflora]|uniref:Uncharacterized protein n=1 Tax=Kingdonia uniflora TaxID=39325 RepID=A0A7J7M2Q7_9MAGN|nr:hypothetical protein GIB67_026025 [Kingdonia uniflora]
MGCRGKPLFDFDLNEPPVEEEEENSGVLCLQPQRTLPLNTQPPPAFLGSSESFPNILNNHAFVHEPSVSGFQPFVKSKEAYKSEHVKHRSASDFNADIASSAKTALCGEQNITKQLLAPGPTPTNVQAVEREEGEWSDVEGSTDALSSTKHDISSTGVHDSIQKQRVGKRTNHEIGGAAKDESSSHAFGLDLERTGTNSRNSDGKGDTSVDEQEESSQSLKQRIIKGVEANHAPKSVTNLGKKHKMDPHKEAMLGKKRARQIVLLDFEDVKQAGPIKSSTPRRHPSSITTRTVKETRTFPPPTEHIGERQGQSMTSDQKQGLPSSSDTNTPMDSTDTKSESNGDMNQAHQARGRKLNSGNELSSDIHPPPPVSRQGLWKQPTDSRELKNVPVSTRKPTMGNSSSSDPKLGNKKPPPFRKQIASNSQYQDTSVERLLREVTNEKFWHHPEVTELQSVPGRFESAEEYVRVFEPLLFEECRAQLYSTWEESTETLTKDAHTMVRIKSVERRERGWFDIVVLPATYDCKWAFKEGDVAVLSSPRPGAVRFKRNSTGANKDDVEGEVNGRVAGTVRRHIPLDTRDPPGAILHFYVGDTYDTNSKVDDDHMLRKLQPKGIWYLTVLGSLATTQPAGTSTGTTKKQDPWPFTLVQGPPGTGKTHTVWGMLNVIHLVQYQRYYAALLKKLAPESYKQNTESNSETFSTGSIDEVLQSMDQNLFRTLPKLCPKPRMLVCAPSNAATDELLARVLDRGFIDGEMKVYRPDVARVGVDSQTGGAQRVSVEGRTTALLAKSGNAKGREQLEADKKDLRAKESQLSHQITCLQRELNLAAAAGRTQGSVGIDPDVLVARDHIRDRLLQNLAAVVEERDKVLVDMSRILIVEGTYRPGSKVNYEEARANLEASFANEAEVVFTTVSSSGRKLFSRLTHGFDMVVVDEAAQASEVGALPPLALGAARCVLVGDPQQLPATVISKAAGTLLYSRSLFERFQQAGCPTILLSVQYRMHPQIRDFPSRYFYQGRLTDSESVKNLPDEIYYKDPLLRPYTFFDITHGRESHSGGSVSYQNTHEAQFCLRLYEHLQKTTKSLGINKVSVGIITPYKLQLKCLRDEFKNVFKSEEGKDLYINTVDAFQGQERDVIIMSCVRASSHGVGFVADIRRMNVALTRARRALWVMGNANSLMQSDDWAALITDAKSRNCFLDMESLAKEFQIPKNGGYKSLKSPLESSLDNLEQMGEKNREAWQNGLQKKQNFAGVLSKREM